MLMLQNWFQKTNGCGLGNANGKRKACPIATKPCLLQQVHKKLTANPGFETDMDNMAWASKKGMGGRVTPSCHMSPYDRMIFWQGSHFRKPPANQIYRWLYIFKYFKLLLRRAKPCWPHTFQGFNYKNED